jgi:hypothetical protein
VEPVRPRSPSSASNAASAASFLCAGSRSTNRHFADSTSASSSGAELRINTSTHRSPGIAPATVSHTRLREPRSYFKLSGSSQTKSESCGSSRTPSTWTSTRWANATSGQAASALRSDSVLSSSSGRLGGLKRIEWSAAVTIEIVLCRPPDSKPRERVRTPVGWRPPGFPVSLDGSWRGSFTLLQ